MKKIMIVDDSLIMRMNLKKIFEGQGFQVAAEATNGQEAVQKYETLRPDLVTMDITMPVMDGITALECIRQEDPYARVVMISALGQEVKIIEAINKGAQHYIVKPFDEKTVLRVVNRVLQEGEAAC